MEYIRIINVSRRILISKNFIQTHKIRISKRLINSTYLATSDQDSQMVSNTRNCIYQNRNINSTYRITPDTNSQMSRI